MVLTLFSLVSFSPLSYSNLGLITFVSLLSLSNPLDEDQPNSTTFQTFHLHFKKNTAFLLSNENNFH